MYMSSYICCFIIYICILQSVNFALVVLDGNLFVIILYTKYFVYEDELFKDSSIMEYPEPSLSYFLLLL